MSEYLYDPITETYTPVEDSPEAPAVTSRDQLMDKHARKRFIDQYGEAAFFDLPAKNPTQF